MRRWRLRWWGAAVAGAVSMVHSLPDNQRLLWEDHVSSAVAVQRSFQPPSATPPDSSPDVSRSLYMTTTSDTIGLVVRRIPSSPHLRSIQKSFYQQRLPQGNLSKTSRKPLVRALPSVSPHRQHIVTFAADSSRNMSLGSHQPGNVSTNTLPLTRPEWLHQPPALPAHISLTVLSPTLL